ncbi:MAG: serine O-acetyltransferase EpsC [Oleiphilaceae bacterium]|nr:serine O-acetyltransferase EpsC [Oleiphilaceae bacterium]
MLIPTVVDQLRKARYEWRQSQGRDIHLGSRELPSRQAVYQIMDRLSGVLFPMRLGPPDLTKEREDHFVAYHLGKAQCQLQEQVALELAYIDPSNTSEQERQERANTLVDGILSQLPDLRVLLDQDVVAAYHGDPAATCVDEVLITYPGVHAVMHHRIAHVFYHAGLKIIARIISEKAHSATGIDIHPGATIGRSFFIDHGTGVVIGETAILGDRVRLYQAVTLGAVRFNETPEGSLAKGEPRHPVVEDDVVIYAGATILGRITIGRASVIGGNVWLTRSVPAESQISQASLRQDKD